ncbi:MAG: dockerin type I repeat-containing protein, partial [Oscillospiraceae bacterium]|nr:dockerin type I repeat-containing protein [Oscillospiraceae bacterium]
TQPETSDTTQTETKPTCYGDVNCDGKISIVDVLALNLNLLTGAELSEIGILNADVNKNGIPDSSDALTILKAVIKIAELPVI